MRASVLVLALATLLTGCAAAPRPAPAGAQRPFHMRTYWLVLLRRGPSWSAEETAESKRLFAGHMDNIRAMARARKLLLAGPFDTDARQRDGLAGLFLFDVASADEVKQLLTHDPAIAAGRLVPELLPWYGPAGITYDGHDQALAAPPTTP